MISAFLLVLCGWTVLSSFIRGFLLDLYLTLTHAPRPEISFIAWLDFKCVFYVCWTRRKHSLISLAWQCQYLIQWRVLTYIHTMNLTTFALFSINLFLFHTRHLFAANFRFLLACFCYTVCPRSSDQFYIVSYHIKWVTTFWTYSISKK